MPEKNPSKAQRLKENGTLNPHPERIQDRSFQELDFFDARDLLQVKYEMLRRVSTDGWLVSHAAEAFGFSRPSFYKAQAAFQDSGLWGLMPAKRGPRQAHKLSESVLRFVEQLLEQDPGLVATTLAMRIEQRFGRSVHPRSIERALKRQEKKPGSTS
jgi:transposase